MNLTPLLAVAAPSANPASNWITLGLFIMFVATTVAGALIAVNTVRIIRSVSGLALACVGLAGLFYFLHSPFLALMEILIYIGAVCVTIIFGVMLAEPDEPAPTGAELTGRAVGHVPEPCDRGADLRQRGGRHHVGPVERVRHRRGRHPGEACDLGDADRA